MVVDGGSGEAWPEAPPRDLHPAEPVRPYVVLVAAVEAAAIGEEADRDPAVVDAEQLVHRRAGGSPIGKLTSWNRPCCS